MYEFLKPLQLHCLGSVTLITGMPMLSSATFKITDINGLVLAQYFPKVFCQSWRCYCSRPIPLSTRNDSKQCAQRWRLQLLPPPILRETVVVFGIRSEGLVGSRMRKEEKWIKLRIQSRVRDERAGLDNPFVNR